MREVILLGLFGTPCMTATTGVRTELGLHVKCILPKKKTESNRPGVTLGFLNPLVSSLLYLL